MKQIIKLCLVSYDYKISELKIFFHRHPCSCIPPSIFFKSPRQNFLQVILEKEYDQFEENL